MNRCILKLVLRLANSVVFSHLDFDSARLDCMSRLGALTHEGLYSYQQLGKIKFLSFCSHFPSFSLLLFLYNLSLSKGSFVLHVLFVAVPQIHFSGSFLFPVFFSSCFLTPG